MKKIITITLIISLFFNYLTFFSIGNEIDDVNMYDNMLVFSGKSNHSEYGYEYITISNKTYTFKEGDYLEYQTNLDKPVKGIGGIDIITSDNSFLRDTKEWVDQDEIQGHPSKDLTGNASFKWFTRKMKIPQSYFGKTSYKWDVAIQAKLLINSEFSACYDNIVIKNKDGIIMERIYTNEESISSSRDFGNNKYHANISIKIREDVNSESYMLESTFGKIELSTSAPEIFNMWLRQPDGTLSKDSVLSRRSFPWNGAYTYVETKDGKRYLSKFSKAHTSKIMKTLLGLGDAYGIEFNGIELVATDGEKAPVTQNWKIYINKNGELKWDVDQKWSGNFEAAITGTPAIFLGEFGGYGTQTPKNSNHVTTTLWYNPERQLSEYYWPYETSFQNADQNANDAFMTDNVAQTVMDPNAWAVYKLYTTFDVNSDIKLTAENGAYLYRRAGLSAGISEIGTSIDPKMSLSRKANDEDKVSVVLATVDKYKTGNQLNFSLPQSEKDTEQYVKDIYQSVINGGILADAKNFALGNSSDGCNYSGVAVAHGLNLLASIPGQGKLASDPYDFQQTYKRYIYNILKTAGTDGLTTWGYNGIGNAEGAMLDENLNVIIGSYYYYIYTGDSDFLEYVLPYFERMLETYTKNITELGLYKNPAAHAAWYYDALRYSGYNTYINSMLFKSLNVVADFNKEIGNLGKSEQYLNVAIGIKTAMNEVMWNENASGGPRYTDWMEDNYGGEKPPKDINGKYTTGTRQEYFIDICQYPAIFYGIADLDKATKIIQTADKRIKVLVRDFNYKEWGSTVSLWPIDDPNVNILGFKWGEYFNGGSIFAVTYFEVMARAMSGNGDSAYYRLQKFIEGYKETKYYGTNTATMDGRVDIGGEAYLGDFVSVVSGLIQGNFGILPTIDELSVNPSIPTKWGNTGTITQQTIYKGVLYNIEIDLATKQVIKTPVEVVYDFDNTWREDGSKNEIKNLQNGLISGWEFDDKQEPTMNAIGTHNPAKISGGYPNRDNQKLKRQEAGKYGKSFYFAGAEADNMHLNVFNSFKFDKTQSFSLTATAKVDPTHPGTANTMDSPVLLSKQNNWWLAIKESKASAVLVDDNGGVVEIRGTKNIIDNKFHNITAVVDRGQQKYMLYVDGLLEAEVDISHLGNFNANKTLAIGAWEWRYGQLPFKGWLDDVGIFGRALSPTDIQTLNNQGLAAYKDGSFYDSYSKEYFHRWKANATLKDALVQTQLNGGTAKLQVSSLDGNKKVVDTKIITLLQGKQTYSLLGLKAGVYTKVTPILTVGSDKSKAPTIDFFEVHTDNKYTISDVLNYNMAYGKRVFSSSVFDNRYKPENLVDGQIHNVFNSVEHGLQWSSAMSGDTKPWVLVDLEQVEDISKIGIEYPTSDFATYSVVPKKIIVQVSEDGIAFQDILTISNELYKMMPIENDSKTTNYIWKYNLPSGTKCRYVKLLFPEGSQHSSVPQMVQLGELQVYNSESISTNNVAVVTASSEYSSAYLASKSTNGILTDSWASGMTVPESYLNFDFGKKQEIKYVDVYYSIISGGYNCTPNKMIIQTSDDGTIFVDQLVVTDIPKSGQIHNNQFISYLLPQVVNARYLRLLFPIGGSNLASPNLSQIGEVKFPYKNSTLKASSTLNQIYIVDNIVDNITFLNNSLWSSDGTTQNSELLFNFENVKTMNSIILDYAKYFDNYNCTPKGFEIYSSVNGTNFEKVATINSDQIPVSGSAVRDSLYTCNFNKTVTSNYIKIVFPNGGDGNYVQLGEVSFAYVNLQEKNNLPISNLGEAEIVNGIPESPTYIAKVLKVKPEFSITSPSKNSTIKSPTTITWDNVDSSIEYRVVISENLDLSKPVIKAITRTNKYTCFNLKNGIKYYMYVLAYTNDGTIKNINDIIEFNTESKGINNFVSASDIAWTKTISFNSCDNYVWKPYGQIDRIYKREGLASYQFIGDNFTGELDRGSNLDISSIEKNNAALSMWVYVSDANSIGDSSQLELRSSASPDNEEFHWEFGSLGLQKGWQKIVLPLNSAATDGIPKLDALRYLRFYRFGSNQIIIRFDDIRIIDTSSSEGEIGTYRNKLADGSPLILSGKTYEKGIGMKLAAYQIKTVELDLYDIGSISRFDTAVGIADSNTTAGDVVFKILADEKLIYTSNAKSNGKLDYMKLELNGAVRLHLVAENKSSNLINVVWGDTFFIPKEPIQNTMIIDNCDNGSVWGNLPVDTFEKTEGNGSVRNSGVSPALNGNFNNTLKTDLSFENGALSLWLFIDKPERLKSNDGQIEINSSGNIDEDELAWNLNTMSLESGWNYIVLPFYSSLISGNPDLNKIKQFRVYTKTDENIILRIDRVAFGNTDKPETLAKPIILEPWKDAAIQKSVLIDNCDTGATWGWSKVDFTERKVGTGSITSIGTFPLLLSEFKSTIKTNIDYHNQALTMWLYLDDVSKMKQDARIQLSSVKKADTSEFAWNLNDLGLKNGWNKVKLRFDDSFITGSVNANEFNMIRIYAQASTELTMKIDNIMLTDVRESQNSMFKIKTLETDFSNILKDSRVLLDSCDSNIGWKHVRLDKSHLMEGKASLMFEGVNPYFEKKFTPINTGMNELYGAVELWLFIEDASKLSDEGQIEISSSGRPDVNEYNWKLKDLDLQSGWNKLVLKIQNANIIVGSQLFGGPDLTAINYFRVYSITEQPVRMQIDSICFINTVDKTNSVELFPSKIEKLMSGPMKLTLAKPIVPSIPYDFSKLIVVMYGAIGLSALSLLVCGTLLFVKIKRKKVKVVTL